MKSLSAELMKWRKGQLLSLERASKRVGISLGSYYRYEQRVTIPTFDSAVLVGKVLNLEAPEIIEMAKYDKLSRNSK